ncbi:Uncharacterised protein [Candidatus Gugararchaeum adminiculabundum]|nr:Uncharacterised protein [Candidatus Gugararchaeum adminiculabundum]
MKKMEQKVEMRNEPEGEKKIGERPDFRIVQPETVEDGSTVFKSVGAMWKKTSKSGNEFYTLKIGKLKLLVFKNTPRPDGAESA